MSSEAGGGHQYPDSAEEEEQYRATYAVTENETFGGHEFAYESSTDLFRCVRCRAYEVTVRNGDGEITPCPGDVPGEPMVLNAW